MLLAFGSSSLYASRHSRATPPNAKGLLFWNTFVFTHVERGSFRAEFVDRLSLAEMGENRCGTVAQIEGDSRFISRIVSIGLTPGSAFTLLKNDKRSPVLVFCRDTVIAVNHKESSQIFVKVES